MITAPAISGFCILIGLLLVFFGRRLFWVFVATVGFIAGMRLAPILIYSHPQWVILACGLALGILGALFAVLLQRVAIAVAGAAAGGALAARLALEFGWSDPVFFWGAAIVGAILVAALATVLFDWALIWLTATTGALLICDALVLAPSVEWTLGVMLFVLGILVQARALMNPPASGT
jgi:hypothetical protein